MDTFYKYTTNFGADFFIRPKVKISNPSYLNDPFESEPGDNLVHVVDEGLKRRGAQVISSETYDMTRQMLKSNGIFSVSETPRNPLMWAHYAEEHRGICIGYSKDIFCNAIKPTGNDSLLAE
ncbi:TPA: DUF2971 domain-containing protein, partial [Aeromonas hydrophila]|nr:DUF2971 domain-containing protein [Aeromonas hydrophila]